MQSDHGHSRPFPKFISSLDLLPKVAHKESESPGPRRQGGFLLKHGCIRATVALGSERSKHTQKRQTNRISLAVIVLIQFCKGPVTRKTLTSFFPSGGETNNETRKVKEEVFGGCLFSQPQAKPNTSVARHLPSQRMETTSCCWSAEPSIEKNPSHPDDSMLPSKLVGADPSTLVPAAVEQARLPWPRDWQLLGSAHP